MTKSRFINDEFEYMTIEPGPKPAPATKEATTKEGTDEAGK